MCCGLASDDTKIRFDSSRLLSSFYTEDDPGIDSTPENA
jgi:hypothetical protein